VDIVTQEINVSVYKIWLHIVYPGFW